MYKEGSFATTVVFFLATLALLRSDPFWSRAIAKMNAVPDAGDNLEEIYVWIEQIPFSRPKKNLARDFSDGVFMAELLKRYYPRYVDVHNYIAGNSVAKKIDNWCTLNRKVLSKLDIKLNKETINQLANSQPGVIEKVLIDLRAKILKDCNAERDSMYSEYDEEGKGGKGGIVFQHSFKTSYSTFTIKNHKYLTDEEVVKSVLNTEEVANKMVPKHVFIKLKQALDEKNDTITTLHQKVSHLESLMRLKDQRIADLTSQISRSNEKDDPPTRLTTASTTNSKQRPVLREYISHSNRIRCLTDTTRLNETNSITPKKIPYRNTQKKDTFLTVERYVCLT